MTEPTPYLVVEDNVMLMNGELQLNIQEEQEFAFPATGVTYYFGLLQPPGHPGQDYPNAVVEGCGGPFLSLGYVSQFPENDANPFVSIDCQENIGSYDPNDKIGYPVGREEDHFIEKNQDIEYRIRFQNTGTDTAFTVVILDTLAEHLDVSSLDLGTYSHAYRMDILDGKVLRFTFENIMLPDSNINEPASHGFLKFRIAQEQDLPLGTVIRNSAAIYFDFNPPVITNESFHTIGAPFLFVTNTEEISPIPLSFHAKTQPNPFEQSTEFELPASTPVPIDLLLFDALGRPVRQEQFQSHRFTFDRKGLAAGLYFYQLQHEDKRLAIGKIIIQE